MTTETTTPTTPAQGSPAAGKDGATAQATSAATAATTEAKDAKATTAEAQQEQPKKETVQAGTEAAKKDDAGAESKKDEAVVAPLEVKFKEGLKVDEARRTEFLGLAKDYGLDSAKAQRLVDLHQSLLESAAAVVAQEEKAMEEKFNSELQKEFGAKLPAVRADAEAFLERVAGKKFVQAAKASGALNFPDFVRGFSRMKAVISEDSIAGTTKGSADEALSKEEKALRALYPTSFAKK